MSLEYSSSRKKFEESEGELEGIIRLLKEAETSRESSNELERRKNQLELEEAKRVEKINIKKTMHCRYLEEDGTYLNKLVQF